MINDLFVSGLVKMVDTVLILVSLYHSGLHRMKVTNLSEDTNSHSQSMYQQWDENANESL